MYVYSFFTARRHARYMPSSCVCPSVRRSVTSRRSTETAKSRITQTTSHDSLGTLVFSCRRSKLKRDHPQGPNGGANCRWGRLNWRLSINTSIVASVVNLVRSQVYHTERPPLFAARLPWVCQQQLILVIGCILWSRTAERVTQHWSGNRLSSSAESSRLENARRNGNVQHRTSHTMWMMWMMMTMMIMMTIAVLVYVRRCHH